MQRMNEENSDELDSLPPTEDIYLERLEIQFSFQRKKQIHKFDVNRKLNEIKIELFGL